MSRILAKQSSLRKFKLSLNSHILSSPSPSPSPPCSAELEKIAHFLGKITPATVQTRGLPGFRRFGIVLYPRNVLGEFNSFNSTYNFGNLVNFRGYASAAEAIVSEEDSMSSGSDDVHEFPNTESYSKAPKMTTTTTARMGVTKDQKLRKRQIKIETEAWEEAAMEYRELMTDMCERKLAPNLPYVKSLLLGWFEPLRDAIAADQEMCRQKKTKPKPSYAEYLDQLPADMMAVITMHKLMGLLMTSSGAVGCIRVVQAACQIGEAIEHEVGRFEFFFAFVRCLKLEF